MNAYTEENFNKMLDLLNERKLELETYARSTAILYRELVVKHGYTPKQMTDLIDSYKE